MSKAILLPLLVVGLCCLQGCKGRSLEGTWVVTPAEQLPVEATIKTTFAGGDPVSTIVQASVPMAGDSKLVADVAGTWKLEGEKLTVTANDVKLTTPDGKESTGFMADQAKGMIKDNLSQGLTGTVKWASDDKFTVLLSNGKTATFDRDKKN